MDVGAIIEALVKLFKERWDVRFAIVLIILGIAALAAYAAFPVDILVPLGIALILTGAMLVVVLPGTPLQSTQEDDLEEGPDKKGSKTRKQKIGERITLRESQLEDRSRQNIVWKIIGAIFAFIFFFCDNYYNIHTYSTAVFNVSFTRLSFSYTNTNRTLHKHTYANCDMHTLTHANAYHHTYSNSKLCRRS